MEDIHRCRLFGQITDREVSEPCRRHQPSSQAEKKVFWRSCLRFFWSVLQTLRLHDNHNFLTFDSGVGLTFSASDDRGMVVVMVVVVGVRVGLFFI